eukprot:SAG11_NODE_6_length_32111_cov_33.703174_6_plen_812_part_00
MVGAMLFAFQILALIKPMVQMPPAGWSTWNTFSCDINATLVKQGADLHLASSGLLAAGYRYILVNDCWSKCSHYDTANGYCKEPGGRDEKGNLIPDPLKWFPDGIKAVADYVHSVGALFGICTSIGPAFPIDVQLLRVGNQTVPRSRYPPAQEDYRRGWLFCAPFPCTHGTVWSGLPTCAGRALATVAVDTAHFSSVAVHETSPTDIYVNFFAASERNIGNQITRAQELGHDNGSHVNSSSPLVTFTTLINGAGSRDGRGTRFILDNVWHTLSSSQMYVSRATQELFVWPAADGAESVEAVAPTMFKLVLLDNVTDIVFSNLTFADTSWASLGSVCESGIPMGHPNDGAIRVNNSSSIVVETSVFDGRGGYAVVAGNSSHDVFVVGNAITNGGQGAVLLHGNLEPRNETGVLRMRNSDGAPYIYNNVVNTSDSPNTTHPNDSYPLDTHSVVADPMFSAPALGDYSLHVSSPAWKLGWQQLLPIIVPELRPKTDDESFIEETDGIQPIPGWFGVYAGDDFYPSAYSSANETVWDTFKFGRATIVNAASGSTGPTSGWKGWKPAAKHGRMTLQQNIETHCARSNSVFEVVSSAQLVSNSNDTNMWVPLPQGSGGMIQAAARWSKLSRHGCPQISDIIFDDFLRIYIGRVTTGQSLLLLPLKLDDGAAVFASGAWIQDELALVGLQRPYLSSVTLPISIGALSSGNHTHTIMSSAIGISHYPDHGIGRHKQLSVHSITEDVVLETIAENMSLTVATSAWSHLAGLTGERQQAFSGGNTEPAIWANSTSVPGANDTLPLSWFRTTFFTVPPAAVE